MVIEIVPRYCYKHSSYFQKKVKSFCSDNAMMSKTFLEIKQITARCCLTVLLERVFLHGCLLITVAQFLNFILKTRIYSSSCFDKLQKAWLTSWPLSNELEFFSSFYHFYFRCQPVSFGLDDASERDGKNRRNHEKNFFRTTERKVQKMNATIFFCTFHHDKNL